MFTSIGIIGLSGMHFACPQNGNKREHSWVWTSFGLKVYPLVWGVLMGLYIQYGYAADCPLGLSDNTVHANVSLIIFSGCGTWFYHPLAKFQLRKSVDK